LQKITKEIQTPELSSSNSGKPFPKGNYEVVMQLALAINENNSNLQSTQYFL
jgi:hypothetical protein